MGTVKKKQNYILVNTENVLIFYFALLHMIWQISHNALLLHQKQHQAIGKGGHSKTQQTTFLQASAALNQKRDEWGDLVGLTTKKISRMSDGHKQLLEPLLIQLLNKGLRGELTRNTYLAEYNTSYDNPPLQPQHQNQSHVPLTQHECPKSSWTQEYHYTSL